MSDIMNLQRIASNAFEEVTVLLIKRGVTDLPRSLYKRHDYYKSLFDKSVKSGKMSEEFKEGFSMFVSRSADINVDLRKTDYVDG